MLSQEQFAEKLAQKHKISTKRSNLFIDTICEIIRENINEGNSVKIKGLGTFKIVSVKDRESINVNNGERVTLSGYDKLSFTPDRIMKEVVNRPFAEFEPVELNDGVTFDDIEDNPYANISPVAQVDDNEPDNAEEDAYSQTDDDAIEQELDEPLPQDEPLIATVADIPTEESTENSETDDIISEENPVQKATDTEYSAEDNGPNEAAEIGKKDNKTVEQKVDEAIEKEAKQDTVAPERKTFSLAKLATATIIALAIGIGIGYFIARQTHKSLSNVIFVENDSVNSSEIVDAVPETNAINPQSSDAAESSTNDSAKEASSETSAKESTPVATLKDGEKSYEELQAEYEAKYPEVRYGAYRIVGVDQTITVKKGQTLNSISRSYLGPDMKCYVVAINGGVQEVKEGQTLKIPKLKTKRPFKKK